jgi:hypothetical protein
MNEKEYGSKRLCLWLIQAKIVTFAWRTEDKTKDLHRISRPPRLRSERVRNCKHYIVAFNEEQTNKTITVSRIIRNLYNLI